MKKSICRVLSLMLSLSFVVSCMPSVLAVSSDTVTEETNANHQAIRTLERATTRSLSSTQSDEQVCVDTKQELSMLGMEDCFIENMTEEQVLEIADSDSIYAVVSYVKFDAEDNMQYITEDEALAAEKAIATAPRGISDQDQLEDSYMRLFFMVSHQGGGVYKFSTDARWLKMPAFRGKDSVGGVAKFCTVTPKTSSGYMEYDYVERNSVGNIVKKETGKKVKFTSSQLKEATKDNFHGVAAVFDVPQDRTSKPTGGIELKRYTNVKVHSEYKGKVATPDSALNFNAAGSYAHSIVTISVNPGVNISLAGAKPSIGVALSWSQERRNVPLELNYRP